MARDDAQHGFDAGVQTYVRARPAYPDIAGTSLMDRFEPAPSALVVDLGVGTGIFNRRLSSPGLFVSAVEPVATMRASFRAAHASNLSRSPNDDLP